MKMVKLPITYLKLRKFVYCIFRQRRLIGILSLRKYRPSHFHPSDPGKIKKRGSRNILSKIEERTVYRRSTEEKVVDTTSDLFLFLCFPTDIIFSFL